MRVVIVGASRFGYSTARQLLDKGHEVVIVDKDSERLEEIKDSLDCGLIHGDGSLPTIQRDAFGDHADALVLLTNQDDVNILAATVGRSVGFERVIPQIVRGELLSVAEELGLDDLITPHATVARSIVRILEDRDDAAMDLRFYRGVNVLGYPVGPRCAGREVSDLGLPDRARVIGLLRGEDEEFIFDHSELRQGDKLILVAADDAIDAVDEALHEEEVEKPAAKD